MFNFNKGNDSLRETLQKLVEEMKDARIALTKKDEEIARLKIEVEKLNFKIDMFRGKHE